MQDSLMEQSNLITYLDHIIQLEKSKYLQTKAWEALNAEHTRALQITPPPTQRTSYSEWWHNRGNVTLSWVFGGLIGILQGLLLKHAAGGGAFVSFLVFVIGVVIGLTGGRMLVRMLGAVILRNKRENRIADISKQNQTMYNRALGVGRLRASQLSYIMNEQANAIAKTDALLQTYYAAGVLHPKYRNFIAVASFYDFFSTKICDNLHGPQGAYNLFEQYSRMDRIITQLDRIITLLEQIKNNQHTIYSAITSANQKLGELVFQSKQLLERSTEMVNITAAIAEQEAQQTQALNFIAKNSAIVAYNAWEDARERDYRNWLLSFRDF